MDHLKHFECVAYISDKFNPQINTGQSSNPRVGIERERSRWLTHI